LNPGSGRTYIQAGPGPVPQHFRPSGVEVVQIRPSAEDKFKGNGAEQVLPSLSPLDPLGFDVVAYSGEVRLQIAGTAGDIQAVNRQVSAHYPSTEVFPSSDLFREAKSLIKYGLSYRLKESYLFQIRTRHAVDPYTSLLAEMAGATPGECALFQVLFIPVRGDWAGNVTAVARDTWDPSRSPFVDLPQLPKIADGKVGTPLFAAAVRLAASSKGLLDRLEGAFLSLFAAEANGLVRRDEPCPVKCIIARTSLHHGMVLNAQELAALVHLPDPNCMPRSLVSAEPGAPAPPLAPSNILVPLGTNRYRGQEVPTGLPPHWIPRHVAISGATGSGKSNLLYLFCSVVDAGYGLAFIDPAGDTADGFLRLIPGHRVADTIYLNFGDRDHPPALNVLESSGLREAELLAGELLTSLKRLFQGSSEFGPRMEYILRQAIRTLLLCSGEKTLRDIPHLLSDKTYRVQVLETVEDVDLRYFWEAIFPHFPASAIDPVLTRLSAFLDNPLVRNIVSQPNRIDFHWILREGKVLLCNLSKGVLGEEAAVLLGSFILTRLQLAAMARAEIPPDKRRLFVLIVDEFQTYGG
jgi:hypothetical protein